MLQVSFARGLLLSVIVGIVFFTELGGARLWDRDEPRNSRASHEMLERGDWIVPTFNGELRDHKPVLLYWGQMLAYQTFGESEFTARLPSVLASILAVLATAVIASRVSGHRRGISNEGFWAAGALATSLLFVMATRAATPDALLIAFGTLGIGGLVVSTLAPVGPYSSGNVQSARWLPSMFAYAMFGLAILAKGPVGIILPLAVVHIWWCFCFQLQQQASHHRARPGLIGAAIDFAAFLWNSLNPIRSIQALWQLKVIPGLIVAIAISAPWYYQVGIETEGAFLRGFFLDHNVGRAVSSMEGHSGNILFYPVAFLIGTFPWSLWLIPILLWVRSLLVGSETMKDAGQPATQNSPVVRQLLILAAVWIGVYVGAFTIASTKLPSYISPCYPGAALAIGCYLRHFEMNWYAPNRLLRYIAYSTTTAIGAAICVVLVLLSREQAMPLLSIAGLSGVVIAALGIFAFVSESLKRAESWKNAAIPMAWLIAGGCFNVILFGFGTKSVDQYRGDLAILRSAASTTSENTPWISIGGMEPSWVYYLNQNIAEVRDNPQKSETWQQVEEQLADGGETNLIVVGDDAITSLLSESNPLSNYRIEEVDRSRRFLREGDLAIFRVSPLTYATSASPNGATNRAKLATEMSEQLPSADESVEFNFAHQRPPENPATNPGTGPTGNGNAANPGEEESPSFRTASPAVGGLYNPLRPDEKGTVIR